MSRTQISERTTLSASTVSVITGELQERGFIRQCGRNADHVGRPSTLLEVNPEGGYFLGADLTSQNISLGVIDLALRPVMTKTVDEEMQTGEGLYRQLVAAFRDLLRQCTAKRMPVLGIGVATPGLISTGLVIEADNLGWKGVELQTRLQKDLKMEVVVVENDMNAAAYGEFQYGSVQNQSVRNMMLVAIDTGIGAGLIIDGRLYCGTNGFSGEFGHVMVDPNGPECVCGHLGCLEAVAAVPAMLRRYRDRTMEASTSVDLRHFLLEVDKDNPEAIQILEAAATQIGTAIGNQVNVLNVGTIFLGGRIVQTSDLFLDRVQSAVMKVILPAFREGLEIRKSSLGNTATLIGIASLCFTKYFHPMQN